MFTRTENTPLANGANFTREQKSILREVALLNSFILLLLILKIFSGPIAYLGGVCIILYLTFLCLMRPRKSFFIIMGIKLTFDALWDVKLETDALSFNLLELFLVPVIVLLFQALKMKHRERFWTIISILIYLSLIVIATVLNDASFDYKLLIRQSGIFIGFVLGLRLVKTEKDFDLIIYALLISSVVPVLASAIQFFTGGFNIPIFYYTLESVRGARSAGLYFDAATNGMVSIVALITSLYILQSDKLIKPGKILLLVFIGFTLIAVISGATRSILTITALVFTLFFVNNLKKAALIVPVLATLIYFMQPYIEPVIHKSETEIKHEVVFSRLLVDEDYRGMFTGRVSIWQDIMEQVDSGSIFQQIFGSGQNSNAHSSYFFLLLQIGWFGLFFFLFFHLLLFLTIYRSSIVYKFKLLGIVTLFSLLLMSVSATVVTYTSFQWIVYFIIGTTLNMYSAEYYSRKMQRRVGITIPSFPGYSGQHGPLSGFPKN